MADRGDADSLLPIGQLIEDAVGADPQRVQAAQFASQCVPHPRFTLQKTQRVLDRVDQRPVKVE